MVYPQGKPQDMLIDRFWQVWSSAVLFAVIGGTFIVGDIELAIAEPLTRQTLRLRLRRKDG